MDGLGSASPAVRDVDVTDFTNFLTSFTEGALPGRQAILYGDNDVDITDYYTHFFPGFAATEVMALARSYPSRVPCYCWELVA